MQPRKTTWGWHPPPPPMCGRGLKIGFTAVTFRGFWNVAWNRHMLKKYVSFDRIGLYEHVKILEFIPSTPTPTSLSWSMNCSTSWSLTWENKISFCVVVLMYFRGSMFLWCTFCLSFLPTSVKYLLNSSDIVLASFSSAPASLTILLGKVSLLPFCF